MRVAWKDYPAIRRTDGIARGYSYFAESIHSRLMSRIDNSDATPILIHAIPAHLFEPEIGRLNVLFTMWEGPELPERFIERSREADLIVVPSEFCRKVWRKAGMHAEVVPLGIEPELLGLVRAESTAKLRFLFLASKLSRKGWHIVPEAFERAFRKSGHDVELYIKMISSSFDGVDRPKPWITIDGRDLSRREICELYASSAVFVFPSVGEGFGLPVLEAMAAGCLVVSTDCTGLHDFFDEDVGVVIQRPQVAEINYGTKYRAKVPTAKSLAAALTQARVRWGSPDMERRRKTARARAAGYTWNDTVSQFMAVMQNAFQRAA